MIELEGQGTAARDPLWNEAFEWFMRTRNAPDDATQRSQLEAWLALDSAHRKMYRKVERVWSVTRMAHPLAAQLAAPEATTVVEPSPAANHATLVTVRHRWRNVAAAFAVAASLVLALPSLVLHARSDYRTGMGETREVTLPDGSRAHLNANSALSLAFDGRQRGVKLLAGEAFFEVQRDATRPFTVQAASTEVTVLGTAFDVRVNEDSVDVGVQHGVVSVQKVDADAIQLHAGERMVAIPHRTPMKRTNIPPQRVAAWREGRIVVDGAPLQEVIDALGDYHRGTILIASDLEQQRVTGVYDLRNADAALVAIAASLGAEVRYYTPYLARLTPVGDDPIKK